MTDIQNWFEPLLWIVGTITVLAAFVRLCKPVWRIFTAPKEFTAKIDALDEKLDTRLEKIDAKFEKIDSRLTAQAIKIEDLTKEARHKDKVVLSLLHDAIVQIYQEAKEKETISEVSYYRACELYKQDGESPYIDSIMEALNEIHKKGTLDT